jgi:hypothetical protein
MALWCFPLVAIEWVALEFERQGKIRWTWPWHLGALLALVGCLDIMAIEGTTLEMLGFDEGSYLDEVRLQAFSLVLNGCIFLVLMRIAEKSRSLDLRRASKMLEILGILHCLSALFFNAQEHRRDEFVRMDLLLYLAASLTMLGIAFRFSRWRFLVGGLLGLGLSCFLLVDLEQISETPFVLTLGVSGLLLAFGVFIYVATAGRPRSKGIPHPSPTRRA